MKPGNILSTIMDVKFSCMKGKKGYIHILKLMDYANISLGSVMKTEVYETKKLCSEYWQGEE
jgi:hypothetical protein